MPELIDEFWVPAVKVFKTTTFKSVTSGGAVLEAIQGEVANLKVMSIRCRCINNYLMQVQE
tara:strand:- start:1504 stop:1686 length:183 start_codon:yes stop_codon:yes gene_type:complete